MVNAGADWSKPIDEYTLGTGVRFYFNKTGIYLGGGLDWNRFRWSGGKHQTDWGLGIEGGYAFFLSRTVTIEPAVYYKWRFNDWRYVTFRCQDRIRFLFIKEIDFLHI